MKNGCFSISCITTKYNHESNMTVYVSNLQKNVPVYSVSCVLLQTLKKL
jgi:hypothetical protein